MSAFFDILLPAWWYRLSPRQLRIVGIIRRWPYCNQQKIVECLYAGREDGGPELACATVRSQIYYARKKGAPIKNLAGSGTYGYYFEHQDAYPLLRFDAAYLTEERAAA